MGRRKIPEENIRKIQKTSRSYYITLPMRFVRDFGWEAGDEVAVEHAGRGALIVKEPGAKTPSFSLHLKMSKKVRRRLSA